MWTLFGEMNVVSYFFFFFFLLLKTLWSGCPFFCSFMQIKFLLSLYIYRSFIFYKYPKS